MPSQNIISFQCVEVWEEHWLLLLTGPQHRPGLGHGKVPVSGMLLEQVVPEAVWHEKALQNLAAISSRYLQWQPEEKQRIQKCEIFLLESLAFVAKGVLWVRKNNAVLASGPLPSLLLSSPLTPTLFMRLISFSSWRYDSGKCLEIRLCTEGVHSLHIPTALQHTPSQSSTEQGSLVRTAEPKPWPSSPPEAPHNVSAVLTVVCLWAHI